jgi:hypothetical protein
MPIAGHVNHSGRSGLIRGLIAGAGGGKSRVVDAAGMFIDEHKSFGGKSDVGHFLVDAPHLAAVCVICAVQPFASAECLAHGNAPDTRLLLAGRILRDGFIRNALQNRGALADVRPQWRTGKPVLIAGADIGVNIVVRWVSRSPVQAPGDPVRAGIVIRADHRIGFCPLASHEPLRVVITPHAPSQRDLVPVVQAMNSLRFGFGFRQGRQQHCGQDRNNRNDNQ